MFFRLIDLPWLGLVEGCTRGLATSAVAEQRRHTMPGPRSAGRAKVGNRDEIVMTEVRRGPYSGIDTH